VFARLDEPLPLGYCNVGTVIETGAGVTAYKPGDRAASNGPYPEAVEPEILPSSLSHICLIGADAGHPAQEIVAEADLHRGRDRYLDGHRLGGACVLPGTMGIEALAQATHALRPLAARVVLERIRFDRAVSVPDGRRIRTRLCAQREGRAILAALYCEDDGFAGPALRLRVARYPPPAADVSRPRADVGTAIDALPLYGPLFFGDGPFRRLTRFTVVTSRSVSRPAFTSTMPAPIWSQMLP
jgi:hypothetical protein